MKRMVITVVLATILYGVGAKTFGHAFQNFCDSLFAVFPWFVGSLAALSYPFYNYVDGIAKDLATSPPPGADLSAFALSIDRLKREIIMNVLVALLCYLGQTVASSAVAHLGFQRDIGYPIAFDLLVIAVSAFLAQAVGFKVASDMRGILVRGKNTGASRRGRK